MNILHWATELYPVLLGFVLSLALTPLMRHIAFKVGLVDRPDGHRKLQKAVTPLGGGVAILISFLSTIALILLACLPGSSDILQQPVFTAGLCGAAALICLIGVIDDRFELRGRQKLVFQIVAIFFVVWGGLVIETVEIFGWRFNLGILAIPFTAFWLLGAINALNLIDGIDGLAGTVAVILGATFACLASMGGHHADAVVAWILTGSVLGFLIYNLPPARIYMGDAGSMLIGLVLGALAIRSSLKGPATVALAAPTAIWAILAFDIAMAIFRRKLTGRSIYSTDRSHLHHVLQKQGFSVAGVVILIGLLCSLCAAGALTSVALKNEMAAIGTSACVIMTLVLTGLFGRSECALLARKLYRFMTSLFTPGSRGRSPQNHFCSRFHGNREWEILWDSLIDYANEFDLSAVQLNVCSPAIGEEYHAVWNRKTQPPMLRLWRTEIPLFQHDLCVGKLTVMGGVGKGAVVSWMSDLIQGLKPFELRMSLLLEELRPQPRTTFSLEPSAVQQLS